MLCLLTQTVYAVDSAVDVRFNPNVDRAVFSIAPQADGKIIIGGQFLNVNNASPSRGRITRLTAQGTLDASFADVNVNGEVFTVLLQSDRKIIFGGNFTSVNNTSRNRIARLNPDGSLDDDFNPNVTSTGSGVNVSALALQVIDNAEHILIGGNFSTIGTAPAITARNNIARLNNDGSVDTDFVNVNLNGSVSAITIDSNNRTLIGGQFSTVNGADRSIVRLDVNGGVDADFNSPIFSHPFGIFGIFALINQPDNKLLVGGNFSNVAGATIDGLTRLEPNGNLDMGFALPTSLVNRDVEAVALQADGKILFAGSFLNVGAVAMTANLARVNSDGSLDDGFTPNVVATAGSAGVRAIALQGRNENIIIGGRIDSVGGVTRTNLARLGDDDDVLCLPIPIRNNKVSVVCL